ncbi:DHS-like NAD/FAD-binding domain-containing protein [Anaeromyces robustus]|uniref:DHS-like NAD/FAD-binding domain-containing protein n=1 Tax=Anaeromyces robustus TaxID=1754192 RepID=A0A1Y1XJR2_9FUNG|nr:DHS-like NAD/FAD-binding domain-containing protein [Anaeromyces robustus]|eukprot:ORX85706.1 DHS-like NAD/FAD-binding domain-containing protein [Anaeromyces robustus]
MVKVLEEESLAGIAQYIKDHDCKNIIVMSGAGISTNAEIPDFRSADRGVYANVEKYNIPYPEAIFDLEYFKTNPKPFTMFAKEIYPQNIKPTIAHCFIKLLNNHNILLRHYTQNIDGLDYQTRLDSNRIIESHGSFHQSYCVGTSEKESCGAIYSQSWYKERLFKGENPIVCPKCQGYVKPGVIFFKENLPSKFFKSLHEDIPKCDLLLILGTSLKVYPFASIIKSVSKKIPRCLINNTLPEIFESELLCDSSSTEYIFSGNQYKRDVLYLGDCDKGCIELAQALGWEDELMEIYNNEIECANKYFN